jgi:hypothetical protein
MDRYSLRPKRALRRDGQFPVRVARGNTCSAIRIMGCPSFGGQRTHSVARMNSTEPSSSIESVFRGGKSPHRLSVLRRPAHAVTLLRRSRRCCHENSAPAVHRAYCDWRSTPAFQGSRFAVERRTMRTTRERITSVHPKLASGGRKLKHMSTALNSAPNLAFKRTPNGRPRNGFMFILAFARPAVWRRLTLR